MGMHTVGAQGRAAQVLDVSSEAMMAYQQLSQELNGGLCSKLLRGWHVNVINKQHHALTHRRPISTSDNTHQTDVSVPDKLLADTRQSSYSTPNQLIWKPSHTPTCVLHLTMQHGSKHTVTSTECCKLWSANITAGCMTCSIIHACCVKHCRFCMEHLPVSMAAFEFGFNQLLSGYASGLGAES